MTENHAICKVIESWYRAMEKGDVGGLLTLVTSDVIVKPPDLEPVIGKRALKQALSAFLDTHSETVDFEIEELEISGPLAFSRIAENAAIRSKSGANTEFMSGMHLTILRRQPERIGRGGQRPCGRGPILLLSGSLPQV